MRSTKGIWLTIGKSKVYQWYHDDHRDSLRSNSASWLTIGNVSGLPEVSG